MTEIKTLFIFEMLGKPPEHIKDSLEKLIDELGKQEGLKIARRQIHEPKKVEKKKEDEVDEGLYSTFAEVEIITEDIKILLAIVLNMLPSHVEVLEPSEFNLKNFDLSSLLTELTVKMHKYDEVAKALILERNHLLKRLNEAEQRINNLERDVKDDKGSDSK